MMIGGGDKLPRALLERLSPKDREEHRGPVGSGASGVRPGRPLWPCCHYHPGQRFCTAATISCEPITLPREEFPWQTRNRSPLVSELGGRESVLYLCPCVDTCKDYVALRTWRALPEKHLG